MWVCKDCSLVWNYPVKYCTNCGKETSIKKSSKYRIIGFTKVNIPSSGNERTPYYVALMEGENGDKIVKKTFDEPEIGVEFENTIHASRSVVSVWKVKYDVFDSVARVLDLIGGVEASSKSKILIKPNLSFPANACGGVVTNPLVVEGVIRYLLRKGVKNKNLLIGDSCAIGFDMKSAFEKSGIREVCERNDVEFLDLETSGTVTREIEVAKETFSIDFAEEVFKRDLIVNVPVVKTHFQAGVSVALKNMKGCVKNKSKKYMHKFGLQKAVAYMNLLLPRYVTVADGTVGLEGFGPSLLGKPADLGLIFASKDPVALDFTVCKLTGLEPAQYMRLASQMGVGNGNLDEISVIGEEFQAVARQFERPAQEFSPNQRIRVVDGNGCSGCSNNLWLAISRLPKEVGRAEAEAIFGSHFCLSQLDEARSKLGVGNCAIEQMRATGLKGNEIPGCPPSIDTIFKELSETI